MKRSLSDDLKQLIGEPAFVKLAEAFGGTRLYVPQKVPSNHAIALAIGAEAAGLLASRYAGAATLRVPLARDERARHYSDQGLANAQIARKLGMTEPGVERLLGRPAPASSAAAPKSSPQLPLFKD